MGRKILGICNALVALVFVLTSIRAMIYAGTVVWWYYPLSAFCFATAIASSVMCWKR